MAKTTMVLLGAAQIMCDPTTAKTKDGILAADAYPGQYHVIDASTGKWTKAVNTTAAYRHDKGGVLVYKRRQNNNGGTPTIDDPYDIDNEPALDLATFCVKGKVAVFIDDPGATVYPGARLEVGGTAGNLKIVQALEATGASGGTAIRGLTVATLAEKVESGDTRAFVYLDGWNGGW